MNIKDKYLERLCMIAQLFCIIGALIFSAVSYAEIEGYEFININRNPAWYPIICASMYIVIDEFKKQFLK